MYLCIKESFEKMIYLDNSATTKPCQKAVEAINNALVNNWGNPSSTYSHGINAFEEIDDTRRVIASSIGAKPDEIFFTGSGTEANNLAIFGCAHALKKKGKKIVSTAIEHPSVLEALKKLNKQGNGLVSLEEFIEYYQDKNSLFERNEWLLKIFFHIIKSCPF